MAILLTYLATLLGNLLIVTLARVDSRLHTPTYFFLSHLSFLEMCYTTSTIPQMLAHLLARNKVISFDHCMAQMYIALSLGSTEAILLAAMAYDRYVAVCHPLHYATVMSRKCCLALALSSWASGFILSVINAACVLRLPFCGLSHINHFFCELPVVLKLACADTHLTEAVIFAAAVIILLLPLCIILASYGLILASILRAHSAAGRHKAFSTCTSHLAVVSIFYGTVISMYMRPHKGSPPDWDKHVAVFYIVVTPALNPLIYSLRNKEVKGAVIKLKQRNRRALKSDTAVAFHLPYCEHAHINYFFCEVTAVLELACAGASAAQAVAAPLLLNQVPQQAEYEPRLAVWKTRSLAPAAQLSRCSTARDSRPSSRENGILALQQSDGSGEMPRHCSAAGCCTRDTRETRGRGISFHRLPKKDNPRRVMWLENCRRKDPSGQGLWDPTSKYIYFCSKHFEKSCFEMMGISGYHRLKEGAIPTIFESFSKTHRAAKVKPSGQESDSPKLVRAGRRWRHDPGQVEQKAPFCVDVSCFPEEEPVSASSPAAAPAGEHRSLPAVPGPLPQKVNLEDKHDVILASLLDILLEHPPEATGGEEATAKPALPEAETPPLAPEPVRPVSPSLYMLRLPPPAGAYIQTEHSYQVGSALLWKRRAEAALDALDKAQRQLQACKRREQRLRLRIGELQREQQPPADMHRQLKEHLQVFELQLLNDLE
ncbi:THAP domain-containing protein 8 isoform B [Alligator mississippiensis]|uniref:THAP domain-containing protein 8 isoform B n=1 Tax=Alligator mississippiensis TaxID=8496 RepID=A0A151NMP5_ALLMI|nr:THAP domain-containing protein 8 isoform B [Alligator mississippiensis]